MTFKQFAEGNSSKNFDEDPSYNGNRLFRPSYTGNSLFRAKIHVVIATLKVRKKSTIN